MWEGDWELIDGVAIALESNTRNHQSVSSNVFYAFKSILSTLKESNKFEVFFGLDWIVCNDIILRPDLALVHFDRRSEYIEKAPLIVVEIFSLGTRLKDRNTKFSIYEENGVSYYIMIDPDSKKIEIFQLIDNKYKEVNIDTFKLNKNCEVQVDLDSIFE